MRERKPWLEQREDGSRRIRWRGPDGRVLSQSVGRSIRTAKKELRRKARWLKGGRGDGQITIADFVDMLVENFKPHVSAPYWRLIERSIRMIGGYASILDDINSKSLDEMQTAILGCGCRIATVNAYMRHCSAALAKAVEWDLIDSNPMDKHKRMREPEIHARVMTMDEQSRLLNSINSLRDHCMIYLALYGGLRSKEIANVHIFEDINIVSGEVRVRNRGSHMTKSKRERVVFIGLDQMQPFEAIVKTARKRHPFIFWDRNAKAVSDRFGMIKRRAGIDITLQDLRRTCATRMAEAGVPMHTLRDYMGHHSITVTERYYLHVRQESMKEARNLTDKIEQKANKSRGLGDKKNKDCMD